MFRQPGPELTPEERDARTVFCMQLSARIRPRDLEEFFSSVGKVCECYNNLKCVKYIYTKIKIKNHTNKLRIHIVINYILFQVRDVRLIMDNKTRRSKGISYVEFQDTDSVPLAIGLTNQKLLGVPIIVQHSQAEKNRVGNPTSILTKGNIGPMRLYVGSLHFNITEEMLRGIFEPFGKVIYTNLLRTKFGKI